MKKLINISGGAIKFVALAACFKELIDKGIKPKAVSGVSAGSIIALFYVCGKLDTCVELAKQSDNKRIIFSKKNDPERIINVIRNIVLGRNYLGVMDNLEKTIRHEIDEALFNKYTDYSNTPDCYILSIDEATGKKILVNLKECNYQNAIAHVIASSSIAPTIKSRKVFAHGKYYFACDGGHRDHSAGSTLLVHDQSFDEVITIFSRDSIDKYTETSKRKFKNFFTRLTDFTISTFIREVSINDELREKDLCEDNGIKYSPIHIQPFVNSTYNITRKEIINGVYFGLLAARKYLKI